MNKPKDQFIEYRERLKDLVQQGDIDAAIAKIEKIGTFERDKTKVTALFQYVEFLVQSLIDKT